MSNIHLQPVDWLLLAAYFLSIVVIGVLMARKAKQNADDYFLGGRKIPWWALGASGSASNFDITGTMIVTSFFFAIGFQGFWVSTRGGMALGLCVLLAFMGRWLRRSKVMTTAEWMELRFGDGAGGQLARLLTAVANLIFTLGMVIYFAIGTGKFVSTFLPFSAEVCAVGMISIGLAYTVVAGLRGVIYTDILQEILIFIVAGFIIFKALLLPEHSAVLAAAGSQWTDLAPRWKAEPMPWLEDPLIYQAFGISVFFWATKSMIEGLGGYNGYMAQRYYAAPDERSAGLMTAEWAMLLSVRYGMVAALALLGLWFAQNDPQIAALLQADPERTLPIVFGNLLPAGLLGLGLAGLMAAAMSTFDSTINAGAAYWVRDVYQRYIKPDADEKTLMRQGQFATLAIAVIGVLLSLTVSNINEIWSLLTGPLGTALVIPLAIRWYWWRMNGYGFAASLGFGIVAAIGLNIIAPDLAFYQATGATFVISVLTAIFVSLMTPPVDNETLVSFYRQIRPWGAWKHVAASLTTKDRATIKSDAVYDISVMCVALFWQVSLFMAAVTLVWRNWPAAISSFAVFVVLSVVLYHVWYKKLPASDVEAS